MEALVICENQFDQMHFNPVTEHFTDSSLNVINTHCTKEFSFHRNTSSIKYHFNTQNALVRASNLGLRQVDCKALQSLILLFCLLVQQQTKNKTVFVIL